MSLRIESQYRKISHTQLRLNLIIFFIIVLRKVFWIEYCVLMLTSSIRRGGPNYTADASTLINNIILGNLNLKFLVLFRFFVV